MNQYELLDYWQDTHQELTNPLRERFLCGSAGLIGVLANRV